MDWESVVKLTDLPNQDCLAGYLSQKAFTPESLSKLPAFFGRPKLCGTPPTVVLLALRKALLEQEEGIPTIEEEIELLEETERVTKELLDVTAALNEVGAVSPHSPLLKEIDLPGVSPRQLNALIEARITEARQVLNDPSVLDQVPGIGDATREKILTAVEAALNL